MTRLQEEVAKERQKGLKALEVLENMMRNAEGEEHDALLYAIVRVEMHLQKGGF